jgi:hypothetical protein
MRVRYSVALLFVLLSSTTPVTAQEPLALLNDCSRALSRQDGSPRAVQTCREAVAAADEGTDAFARGWARGFLGDVYMFAKRWSDAVTTYQSALEMTTAADADGLKTGELLAKLAIAQANLGDLAAADRNAESAAATLNGSMSAPSENPEKHLTTLRSTLLFHARIKQLRGDTAAARDLDRRADSLQGAR